MTGEQWVHPPRAHMDPEDAIAEYLASSAVPRPRPAGDDKLRSATSGFTQWRNRAPRTAAETATGLWNLRTT